MGRQTLSRRQWCELTLAVMLTLGAGTPFAGADTGNSVVEAALTDREPAAIYREACASCHGPGGAGLSPADPRYETFKVPPADLTDPLFNSREPAADWFLVTKHGGPALGLSSQMPAYDGAYSDDEITGLVDFLKTLVDTSAYPPGELNFPRPVQTIKAFPEDEILILHRNVSEGGADDALRTTLYYARRFSTRQQLEFQASHFDTDGDPGFKELELGWKWAFHSNLERSRLLATGLEVEIPIDGGDETETWIPYLSFAKGFGDLTLQGTLRTHLPSDDFGSGDVAASAVAHWQLSPWPRSVIPGVEATVTSPFESEGDLAATLIPQILLGLNRGGSVALGVGVEMPLTGLDYDYRVRTFLLWDYADGAFWRGW